MRWRIKWCNSVQIYCLLAAFPQSPHFGLSLTAITLNRLFMFVRLAWLDQPSPYVHLRGDSLYGWIECKLKLKLKCMWRGVLSIEAVRYVAVDTNCETLQIVFVLYLWYYRVSFTNYNCLTSCGVSLSLINSSAARLTLWSD